MRDLNNDSRYDTIVISANIVTIMKKTLYALLLLTLLALAVQTVKIRGYSLSYQVSSSMPKGWYLQKPINLLARGDWVFLNPPPFAKDYLIRHHWLPTSGLMLKSVQAMPGDWVCIKDQQLWINDRIAAPVLTQDRNQQAIVRHFFCRTLARDEYLVLGLSDVRSYDSRYFGPVNRKQLLGIATPLFL